MKVQFSCTDTTVAITGAAGGLGKGIAQAFAVAGANVVIGDVKETQGSATVDEFRSMGGKAIFVKTDVTDQASTDYFIRTALDTYGKLDVLVNAAGVSSRFVGNPLTLTEDRDFDLTFNVNFKGIYHTIKSSYNYFTGRKEGKIINLSSVVGHSTNPGLPHYAASKAAAINFSMTMAKELGRHNVKVNCVCPGYVYTDLYENITADIKKMYPEFKELTGEEIVEQFSQMNCVLGRSQSIADIAKAVLYLASDGGDNITGIVWDVAGGYKI